MVVAVSAGTTYDNRSHFAQTWYGSENMLIPIGVDVPTNRRPWVNYLLIGSIIVISWTAFRNEEVLCRLSGLERTTREAESWGLTLTEVDYEFNPSPVMYPVLAITSSFVHGGVWHLAGNMLFLWVFGNALNYKFGHLRYLSLFLLAALISGLAHYATSDLAAVGASGAVYGVMGAFLVFFPRNDVRMLLWIFVYIRPFTVSSIWMILMWVAWDVYYTVTGAETGVAHWAHLGGFIAGFGMAIALAVKGIIQADADEQTLLELFGKSSR